jgi:hypothetical protein
MGDYNASGVAEKDRLTALGMRFGNKFLSFATLSLLPLFGVQPQKEFH